LNRQLKKYFQHRAVTVPWKLEGASGSVFEAAIIIPALAEAESLPQTLLSLASNPVNFLRRTLVVTIVNNRVGCSAGQLQNNQQTLAWLNSQPFPQLNLAWVDAGSPGREIPAKEGVGLARKIGFDLALTRLDWSQRPLLISLDADTLVDKNYLPALFHHFQLSRCGAAVLPFRHQSATEPRQETAIRYYELYLRSYLFGLQQAGSPYAYHTIGSAFACTAAAYVAAGGMNRRRAAEDFYFLQQLAKTTGVEILSGTLVQPSPRFSARVPFGTGKAVQAQVEDQQRPFQFSSVGAFSVLQRWLKLIEEPLSAAELQSRAAELSPVLGAFLGELKFVDVWQKLQVTYSTRQGRHSAFHRWFDGLRTRQLLSRLDIGKSPPPAEAVAEILAWGGYPGIERVPEQLALLESLQQAVDN